MYCKNDWAVKFSISFIICQVTVIAQRQRICLKWMRDRKIDGLQIFVCVKDNVALLFEKLNVP